MKIKTLPPLLIWFSTVFYRGIKGQLSQTNAKKRGQYLVFVGGVFLRGGGGMVSDDMGKTVLTDYSLLATGSSHYINLKNLTFTTWFSKTKVSN